MAKKHYATFRSLLEDYGKTVVVTLQKEMEAAADEIVADMKSRVPVNTGALRDSIHWQWNRGKTAITIIADAANPKNGVKYGRIVEFSPKINKPFFYPAMDAHREAYRARMKETLHEAVEKGDV